MVCLTETTMPTILLAALLAGLPLMRPVDIGALKGAPNIVATSALPDGWGWFQAEGSTWKSSIQDGVWTMKGKGDYAGATCLKLPLAADKTFIAGAQIRVKDGANAAVKIDYFQGDKWLSGSESTHVEAAEWTVVALSDRRAEAKDADAVAITLVALGEGQAQFKDIYFAGLARLEGEAENLMKNGLFENGAGAEATGWGLAKPDDEAATKLSWTPDAAHAGAYGLRLKGAKTWSVAYEDAQPLVRAKTYTLTGWVRVRAGGGRIKFDLLSDDAWLAEDSAESAPADGQWHQLKVVLDATKQPTATRVAGACAATGPDADVDFDDLVLTAKAK